MESSAHGSSAFLIRVQRTDSGLRGEVVVVATGTSRLFRDLWDLMAFLEAQISPGKPPAANGENRP